MPEAPLLASDKSGSDWIAPDCAGMDFYATDRTLQDLLRLYLPADLHLHLTPHYARLGALAGGRLDELARTADRHPPVLHPRDRFGRDEDWIEYHPAYREMEQIAFGDFQFHAMSHRGVFGLDRPLPPVAKYAFQYLFVQGEFGLMCPVSVSDTSIHLIRTFGSNALQDYLLPRMLSGDLATLWKGTQFMTEKAGGSDVGAIETVAAPQEDGTWRLTGDKWFCSHTDADVALMLARPDGAPSGTRGLALFALPRRTRDGRRNAYRIVRLKDKLGTKSMASGEIRLDGAEAYLVGAPDQGLKQMMQQVNLSRLSHGVRAAAMMRRCVNEALAAARGRTAFGRQVVDYPLMRRQLMKLIVPTEQALSMAMTTADAMGRGATDEVRILTGLLKLRACRDNIAVATGAMEARGGNGYIEDWVNPRLVRDAQVGLLWEGTSNINALDVIGRAVGRSGAHHALHGLLRNRLADATALPAAFRAKLAEAAERAVTLAERVARTETETLARQAATALYNAASAVVLAWEAVQLGADARRALVARFVLAHRLTVQDPLAPEEADWEQPAAALLLGERAATLGQVEALLA